MTSRPEGADGVDNKTRGQIVSASDFRFTRLATAECPALREKLRSSGAMNGAIDSAAAKQRRIGRVHNCIDGECGNIAANDCSNDETPGRSAFCHSDFVIPSAFDIRHSSFVIASSLKLSRCEPVD